MDKQAEKKRLNEEIENIMAGANRGIAMRQGQIELLDKLIQEEMTEGYKAIGEESVEKPFEGTPLKELEEP